MNVSAIIVTRGDVDLTQIIQSIPKDWQCLVWDNGAGKLFDYDLANFYTTWSYATWIEAKDLSVYGRYAAVEHAAGDLIYVQDDDVIVSNPWAIVAEWMRARDGFAAMSIWPNNTHVVCNMPQEFRHSFYTDHALVGFGAAFHRDAPERAFQIMPPVPVLEMDRRWMWDCCDIIFTGFTPRVLVDVPKFGLPWENDDNRMWKQPTHQAERARMLDLVKQVRNGA